MSNRLVLGPSLMPWPVGVRRAFPFVMTGLGLLALAAPLVIGLWLAWVWDDKRAAGRWAPMLGLALVVGVALIAGRRYRRRVVRSLRDGARTIDFG